MSKRGADDYITRDGRGSMQAEDGPQAQRATAAQLANRKIAAAKPRAGARRGHTPGASSGFSASGGFGTTSQSQSFPQGNGSPSIGGGSASSSFGGFGSGSGGFGSGGGGSGFNFSAGGGGGFNNPFAQQSSNAQESTNGGGGGFNFGGGVSNQPSTNSPFQFGAQPVQPPTMNTFGQSASQPSSHAFSGFGSSQQQPATNMFGASTSQAPQSSTSAFGGFGASAPAPATTTSNMFGASASATAPPTTSSNMFGSTFGATAPPSQPASTGFGGFGQSAAPTTSAPAPSFGSIGQTLAPTPAFGQANGDLSMSTPESSPQKPLWNKQASNGIASGEKSGAESPDRPPHVEQEGEAQPNVFAGLTRPPPQPASTPKTAEATKPAMPLFNFGKPAEAPKASEPVKQVEKEKENQTSSFFTPAKETSTPAAANPFASLKRMPATEQPSSTPQPEQPKTSFFSSAAPAAPATTPAASSNLFQPKASLSNFFSPDKAAPAAESPAPAASKPSNLFAQSPAPTKEAPKPQWGFSTPAASSSTPAPSKSLFTPATQPTQPTQATPAPAVSAPTAPISTPAHSSLFTRFRPEIMREDNLPAPPAQQDLNAEERKLYYRDLKVARLNKVWMAVLPSLVACGDLSPFMGDYAALMAEVMESTKDSRLGQLMSTHGQASGQRLYDQEQGRLPQDGTNKRKAAPAEEQEREKRSKSNGEAAGSSTVNKFQNILGQSADATSSTRNLFGASTASAASTSTSNLFSSNPSAASAPLKNLFGSSATPAASSTSNLFGAATPAPANTSNLFAKSATPANGNLFSKEAPKAAESTPAPSFGVFKPINSSTTSDTSKAPVFGGFKPTLSSDSSAPTGLPKFGGGGSSGGGFMSQFAQSAEETAKKAKQAAMDEEYDSDEETKAEWSARYDRKLEEKKKEMAAAAAKNTFVVTPTASMAGSHAGSGDEAESTKPSYLIPPTAGSFYSGLSRSASPASVTGSVFDAPRSSTPGLSKDNPFASLSRQASEPASEKEDADDEGEEESANGDEQSLAGGHDGADEEEDEATPRANGVVKRQGPFEQDEDSQTETPVKTPRTDGLFGRITRDGDRTPLASTGANAGGLFSTSAPADQTWTPKDPIKFSTNNSSEGESGTAKKPLFNFNAPNNNSGKPVFSGLFSNSQASPATSGAATPSNPFAGLSGVSLTTPASKVKASDSLTVPSSGATSVLSTPGLSRATTPGISDMSGAESTAGEQEDAKPDAQIADMADMADDKKGAEVLYESAKVKANKAEKTDAEEEARTGKKHTWNTVGVGPIAVMRKEGVVSLLMRKVPSGNVVVNARMSSVMKVELKGKRASLILVSAKGPESYLVGFVSEEEAGKFVDVCKANGAK